MQVKEVKRDNEAFDKGALRAASVSSLSHAEAEPSMRAPKSLLCPGQERKLDCWLEEERMSVSVSQGAPIPDQPCRAV